MKKYNIAVSIIRRKDKIVLVKQKSPSDLRESFWSLPGGKLEPNETFIEAAIREAREETGLKLQNDAQLAYICEYKNERENFTCRVEAYEFCSLSGALSPEEASSVIQQVDFFIVPEVISKMAELSEWPMVKDPIISYLRNDDDGFVYWKYEAGMDGEYHLIDRKK